MTNLQKDAITGVIFLTGIVGFISGEFIISSTLFATVAILNSLSMARKTNTLRPRYSKLADKKI